MKLGIASNHKNSLLVGATVLLALVCWKFAIAKTVDAILLNRRLAQQLEDQGLPMVNPAYAADRLRRMDLLLEGYRVDSAAWYDRFWAGASAAAMREGAAISYDPPLPVNDSSLVLRQSARFRGSYRALLLILDSLEHTPGIGKVSRVSVNSVEKAGEGERKLPEMEIELRALPHEKRAEH